MAGVPAAGAAGRGAPAENAGREWAAAGVAGGQGAPAGCARLPRGGLRGPCGLSPCPCASHELWGGAAGARPQEGPGLGLVEEEEQSRRWSPRSPQPREGRVRQYLDGGMAEAWGEGQGHCGSLWATPPPPYLPAQVYLQGLLLRQVLSGPEMGCLPARSPLGFMPKQPFLPTSCALCRLYLQLLVAGAGGWGGGAGGTCGLESWVGSRVPQGQEQARRESCGWKA